MPYTTQYDPFVTPSARCQCHGQCGKATGRRRVCADPDLNGRCRAEHGISHPRSERVAVITDVAINDPVTLLSRWWALCQDCRKAVEAPKRMPPPQSQSLFEV